MAGLKQEMYWHCLQCGHNTKVESTGGEEEDEYRDGDHEPCIWCYGTAHVMPIERVACFEQGLALGLSIELAWERALRHQPSERRLQ